MRSPSTELKKDKIAQDSKYGRGAGLQVGQRKRSDSGRGRVASKGGGTSGEIKHQEKELTRKIKEEVSRRKRMSVLSNDAVRLSERRNRKGPLMFGYAFLKVFLK